MRRSTYHKKTGGPLIIIALLLTSYRHGSAYLLKTFSKKKPLG